jgi:Fic family protein
LGVIADLRNINPLELSIDRLFEKRSLIQQGRPLPNASIQRIRENFAMEWTYNSNSIEGNTLNLRETIMVLKDGITVGGKSLREHFEAINHEKAIDYLYSIVNKKYELRSIDILNLHGLIMKNIQDDFAGRIRNGAVRIVGANFTPPNASKVSDLLDELIEYVNTNPQGLNDVLLATVFHHKLVWIHPFFDGNGRTVRLAMNLLLMRTGFPPAIILKNDRKKYYDALNNANKGDYSKLCLLMAQALERSLNIYISAIPGNEEAYDLISNIVEEDQAPYGQEYISLLARQGKIDAYKEGRNWLTTKKAVAAYIDGRKRKRVVKKK